MRWIKRAFWILIASLLALALFGQVERGMLLALLLFGEMATVVFSIGLLARAWRRARAEPNHWRRLHRLLEELFPSRLTTFLMLEIRMLETIVRWVLRRRRPAERSFRYQRRAWFGVLLAVALVVTPPEILLLHLLIPWDWAKILVSVLAMYALLWLLAFWLALRIWPHTLEGDRLVLRWLFFDEIQVPLNIIDHVIVENRRFPSLRASLTVRENVGILPVGGRTDLTLILRTPLIGTRTFRPTPPFRSLHIAVDEPQQLASALARAARSLR